MEVPRFGFHNHSPTNIDDGGDEIEGKSRDDDEEVDEFQAAEAVLKEIELSENIGKGEMKWIYNDLIMQF